MSQKFFNLAEIGHFVPLIIPHDTNGAAHSSPVVSMKEWAHATIVVFHGAASRAAGLITLESCDDTTPTTHTEIVYSYYEQILAFGAANCDVLGAKAAAATTGIVPAAAITGAYYVIELDASELTAGHYGFRISQADPGAADVMCAFAILSGGRGQMVQKPTQYL